LLFDRIAASYARKDSMASLSFVRGSQLRSAVKPLLDERADLGTIVDIGCGIGAPARYLDGHYQRYIGIDHSEEMIKQAVMFNRDNPRAEFMAKNIKSTGLPRNVADVVLSIGALHHMAELEEVMGSLVSLAKPGASLVAIEPQNKNPLLQLIRWIGGLVVQSYSKEQIFFSEEDLKDLFTASGCTDISVEFQGYLSTPFAQIVMHPQAVILPLSRMAVAADGWLDENLPGPLKKLSFNIVVRGRFPEKRNLT